MVSPAKSSIATLLFLSLATLGGCSEDERADSPLVQPEVKPTDPPPADLPPDLPPSALKERPWEVVSNRGETYLANVFYADPIENEQIMPWTIDGRTQIDRLIYPTIGNPNLYAKADTAGKAADELVMVLRLEPNAYEHLAPVVTRDEGGILSKVALTENDQQSISFFLVARSARASAEASTSAVPGPSVIRITPTKILQNPEPADMPAELKKRHTLRFVFDKAAMANVPAGLYDARFEVRKNGQLFANVFEYQYNAVRVFDNEPDEYSALNVTDTQVSVGVEYKTLTADKLDDFVDGLNVSSDPQVKNAAFITFNGDLHNGGSPGSVRQRIVAKTYMDEAKRILNSLKRLKYPIFLTAGNHDGYAAIGHAPGAVKSFDNAVGDSLQKVIGEQNNKAWPDFNWEQYAAFLTKTLPTPGGLHKDIYGGAFTRTAGAETFGGSFKEVPRAERNMILYDGFYQWQKTYGPLYASWTFGKNRWVSMNSFELRQHRRTGWGMYTVNYGGGVSKPQMEWLDRELARGKDASEEVVVLMHHDPRGGHKGVDLGYYSPTLEYRDIAQSTINYLLNDKLVPLVCKKPELSLSIEERESCLHDGLQEWMAPDAEFEGRLDSFYLSGVELLKRFVKNTNARTLVLGHVHFNSLEVMQPGDVLVPNRLAMDSAAKQTTAALEIANPVRRVAWEDTLLPAVAPQWRFAPVDTKRLANLPFMIASMEAPPIDTPLDVQTMSTWRTTMGDMLARALPKAPMTMGAPQIEPHELAIVRFTSGADLSSQTYDGQSMFGYSVLHVTKQSDAPRVNRLSFFIHTGVDAFAKVQTVDLDRTKSVKTRDATNPVQELFDW